MGSRGKYFELATVDENAKGERRHHNVPERSAKYIHKERGIITDRRIKSSSSASSITTLIEKERHKMKPKDTYRRGTAPHKTERKDRQKLLVNGNTHKQSHEMDLNIDRVITKNTTGKKRITTNLSEPHAECIGHNSSPAGKRGMSRTRVFHSPKKSATYDVDIEMPHSPHAIKQQSKYTYYLFKEDDNTANEMGMHRGHMSVFKPVIKRVERTANDAILVRHCPSPNFHISAANPRPTVRANAISPGLPQTMSQKMSNHMPVDQIYNTSKTGVIYSSVPGGRTVNYSKPGVCRQPTSRRNRFHEAGHMVTNHLRTKSEPVIVAKIDHTQTPPNRMPIEIETGLPDNKQDGDVSYLKHGTSDISPSVSKRSVKDIVEEVKRHSNLQTKQTVGITKYTYSKMCVPESKLQHCHTVTSSSSLKVTEQPKTDNESKLIDDIIPDWNSISTETDHVPKSDTDKYDVSSTDVSKSNDQSKESKIDVESMRRCTKEIGMGYLKQSLGENVEYQSIENICITSVPSLTQSDSASESVASDFPSLPSFLTDTYAEKYESEMLVRENPTEKSDITRKMEASKCVMTSLPGTFQTHSTAPTSESLPAKFSTVIEVPKSTPPKLDDNQTSPPGVERVVKCNRVSFPVSEEVGLIYTSQHANIGTPSTPSLDRERNRKRHPILKMRITREKSPSPVMENRTISLPVTVYKTSSSVPDKIISDNLDTSLLSKGHKVVSNENSLDKPISREDEENLTNVSVMKLVKKYQKISATMPSTMHNDTKTKSLTVDADAADIKRDSSYVECHKMALPSAESQHTHPTIPDKVCDDNKMLSSVSDIVNSFNEMSPPVVRNIASTVAAAVEDKRIQPLLNEKISDTRKLSHRATCVDDVSSQNLTVSFENFNTVPVTESKLSLSPLTVHKSSSSTVPDETISDYIEEMLRTVSDETPTAQTTEHEQKSIDPESIGQASSKVSDIADTSFKPMKTSTPQQSANDIQDEIRNNESLIESALQKRRLRMAESSSSICNDTLVDHTIIPDHSRTLHDLITSSGISKKLKTVRLIAEDPDVGALIQDIRTKRSSSMSPRERLLQDEQEASSGNTEQKRSNNGKSENVP